MKKALLILAVLCPLVASAAAPKQVAQVITPASDPSVVYVGRTLAAEDGSVSFDWSGTTIRIAFSGDYLAMKVSDTKKNYYNVFLDSEPTYLSKKIITTEGSESIVELATKAGKGNHTLVLVKRTEAEQGTTTIHSFISNAPLRKAEGLKKRQIEFIGDSYTCGFGADSRRYDDPFLPETENAGATYAAILGRFFDADIFTIAHSGQGIARNYDDAGGAYGMPERYLCTFDENKEVKWDASACDFKPSVTVIYLCTNDFSLSKQPTMEYFCSEYAKLISEVKANYGADHPILCVASMCNPLAFDYVRQAAMNCGASNVWYAGIFHGAHYENHGDLGACWHPSYEGHKKIAHLFLPYIGTLTGWGVGEDLK